MFKRFIPVLFVLVLCFAFSNCSDIIIGDPVYMEIEYPSWAKLRGTKWVRMGLYGASLSITFPDSQNPMDELIFIREDYFPGSRFWEYPISSLNENFMQIGLWVARYRYFGYFM